MVKKTFDDEKLLEVHRQYGENTGLTSEHLNVTARCIRDRLAKIRARDKAKWEEAKQFKTSEIPSPTRSLDEIFKSKQNLFDKKIAHEDALKSFEIEILLDGPIAIPFFGDPHLDDDGCDIRLVRKHVNISATTEGMFPVNLGDITNNWVGRLMVKYADQITTKAEAIVLMEWMMKAVPWLFVVGGNHDLWSGADDPVAHVCKRIDVKYIEHGVRTKLKFPNGKHIYMNVAHDFPGHSQFNPVHGPTKKAMRWGDNLYVCGHKHNTGSGLIIDPKTGVMCHMLRCDSYKRADEYAKKLGIDDTFVSPCITAIINPYAENERGKIMIAYSLEQAAEILTDMRKRFKKGQKNGL